MQIIPLVRAKYVYAYGAVLDRLGAPTRLLLERVGLSERVLEEPEAIIPAHQAWRFIGSAAAREGIDDLGLMAGDMSIRAFGEFSQRLLTSANLNHALDSFCALARCEYSRADFYVSRSEESVWFCRGPIDGDEVQRKHVELLVLTMMIATVRLAAGRDWHPPVIFLQTSDGRRVEEHHQFSRSTIRFGNRITAFEVPRRLLAEQLPDATQVSDKRAYDQLEHKFPRALYQLVGGMLVDGIPKIGSVAEAVGGSVRTLQRRLSDVNTTFSAVVETAQMRRAVQLLERDDHSLVEIAYKLGYADQANARKRSLCQDSVQYVVLGGQTADGKDATNPLSTICLKAGYLKLKQPTIKVRYLPGIGEPRRLSKVDDRRRHVELLPECVDGALEAIGRIEKSIGRNLRGAPLGQHGARNAPDCQPFAPQGPGFRPGQGYRGH